MLGYIVKIDIVQHSYGTRYNKFIYKFFQAPAITVQFQKKKTNGQTYTRNWVILILKFYRPDGREPKNLIVIAKREK